MYKIHKIDPYNLPTNEIEDLYLINKNLIRKYNFLDRFKNTDEYRTLFLSTFIGMNNELFVLKKDSLVCGFLIFTKSADWNGNEQYKLNISLCNSTIDESMVNSISQLIQDKLYKHGQLALVTYNDELEELIKEYNNKINLKANYYTLKKEDININLLDKSIKEYEIENKDLYIKFTDIISENYINQYCDLFMETMEDMTDVKENGYTKYIITPEKQRQINDSNKKRNITHYCYMIFNSSNKMIAKSNISINNNDYRFPYQFMIGVKRPYRGRNLGKWLYASMYKKLLETVNFESVFVCHHPENKPAINVSKWIGYKFNYLETTHILYK